MTACGGFALLESMIVPEPLCPGACAPSCADGAGCLAPTASEIFSLPCGPVEPPAHALPGGVARGLGHVELEIVGDRKLSSAPLARGSTWQAQQPPTPTSSSAMDMQGEQGHEGPFPVVSLGVCSVPGVWVGGRYEVLSLVAHGECSTLLHAWDHHRLTQVTLKRFHAPWRRADDAQRLVREMLALTKLSGSEHVVGLHDVVLSTGHVGYAGGDVCLVLEHHPSDLQRQASGGVGLEEVNVLHWARGAMLGLRAVHGAGLVHGQVSPAHLLLSHSGRVKIADLAMARPAKEGGGGGDEGEGVNRSNRRLPLALPRLRRQLTSLVPTCWWRACEEDGAHGTGGNEAADMWCLGSGLATLLASAPAASPCDHASCMSPPPSPMGSPTASYCPSPSLASPWFGLASPEDVVGRTLRLLRSKHQRQASLSELASSLSRLYPSTSPSLLSLLAGLLHPDPSQRLTLSQALSHECFLPLGPLPVVGKAEGGAVTWTQADEDGLSAMAHMGPHELQAVVLHHATAIGAAARLRGGAGKLGY